MLEFSVIFEDNFLLLPPKHQQIWKVLWYFCKKFHGCFPSQQKISLLAKCCRRTVINALNSFKNFGWLTQIKRCYRSNIYFIHSDLLKKDPKDQKWFMKNEGGGRESSRESCTQSCTLYSVAKSSVATVRSKDVHHLRDSPNNKPPPKQYIHPTLIDLPFKREDKLMIQRNFRESVIGLALESYKTYRYAKRNPLGLFLSLCGIENKNRKEGKS